MANPTIEGKPGAHGGMIQRSLHALAFWWRDRPTVFVHHTEMATNAAAGVVDVVTDVATAIRFVQGEHATLFWRIPAALDRDRAINVRPIWSKPDTATTNVTWTGLADGVAQSAAPAAPTTALGTVIGAQAGIATANVMMDGNWGAIAAGTIVSAKTWLGVKLTATTLGAGITNVDLYGVEIRYYRRFVD